jgi:tRNA pseudouridine13 synthase
MTGQPWTLPDWSRVSGVPGATGIIRTEPEDFRVEELPLITPAGEGSHLWLEIEKRDANTDWVAKALASKAGVPARDIGYAGMKDRRGVTSQWFSVALQEAGNSDWQQWEIPGVTILAAHLHQKKLKRGALRGNRFHLVVRRLQGLTSGLEERLQRVKAEGVPNYFGPQRFGHGGRNVGQGMRWMEHGGRLPRNKRSIYLSAVRSFLFNEVLSTRVGLGNWNVIIDGDIASLDGSHSTFPCSMPDPELSRRCNAFDIHPSGPLPGRGRSAGSGESVQIEERVLEPYEAMVSGLEKAGLEAARRPLRVVPGAMHWELTGQDLVLGFELSPGAYATSVLRELVSTDPGAISEAE